MVLNIHDFPLRVEDNCIKNCKGEILLNLSKRLSREKVISFIIDSVPAINDGRRVYKKRLTKTFEKSSLMEAIDIVEKEMFVQGYIPSKGISEIEYAIIAKNGKTKIKFNKIKENMANSKDIVTSLKDLLVKLLDAKSQENLTQENKEVALKDLLKVLNMYWENAIGKHKDKVANGLLNQHQDIWFNAIIAANKEVKYPLISITSGLFRCYIITLFGSIGKEDMLKELTGWNFQMLEKEKMTYDMKVLLLSVGQMIKDKEDEDNGIKEAEIIKETHEKEGVDEPAAKENKENNDNNNEKTEE